MGKELKPGCEIEFNDAIVNLDKLKDKKLEELKKLMMRNLNQKMKEIFIIQWQNLKVKLKNSMQNLNYVHSRSDTWTKYEHIDTDKLNPERTGQMSAR